MAIIRLLETTMLTYNALDVEERSVLLAAGDPKQLGSAQPFYTAGQAFLWPVAFLPQPVPIRKATFFYTLAGARADRAELRPAHPAYQAQPVVGCHAWLSRTAGMMLGSLLGVWMGRRNRWLDRSPGGFLSQGQPHGDAAAVCCCRMGEKGTTAHNSWKLARPCIK